MPYARIFALYDANKSETIVIVGLLTENGHLVPKAEAFGYAKDLDEDFGTLLRYPFILEPVDGTHAMLNWGCFDENATRSEIDIMGRRLVKGEKITRRENGYTYGYTIQSVRGEG